jgi:16S rRNA processing protein RimM
VPEQERDQSKKRVCLGKIAQAHGVKGLVKLHVFAEDPSTLNGSLYTDQSSDQTITLRLKNRVNKYWLAEIEGISDRDSAEALRSTELWVNKDQLAKTIQEEEYYVEDLIGADIRNEKSENIGKIKAVNNYGAGDLLDIELADGSELLIPFTKECVPIVNIDQNYITLGNITPYMELK